MIQPDVLGRRGQRVVRGTPGRTLTGEDIAHHQRILAAIKETMRLLEEIDEATEEHEGWPIEQVGQ